MRYLKMWILMKLLFNLKHYLYTGLREVLIYHHNSLEFRAKIFALIVAANRYSGTCEYELVHEAGMQIYKDKDRVNLLLLTTREYVNKVRQKNGLDIDDLILDIQKELQQIPRYADKIDITSLQPIIECCTDEDTSTYQIRILEFLQSLKTEYTKESL